MNKRPDASMDLLRAVTEGALEPEYESSQRPRRTGWITFLGVALLVTLLAMAVVETFESRDVEETARRELLTQVSEAREHQATLGQQVGQLEEEIRKLAAANLPDEERRASYENAELASGAIPVEGPGIVVTVDDATNATSTEGRVLDSDLSMLVNGLFEAGAEAVAINGHRVTTMTPIRTAGVAITVDYVSLNPPYRVEAIGDAGKLPGSFARTGAAAWWQYLTLNYGLSLEVSDSRSRRWCGAGHPPAADAARRPRPVLPDRHRCRDRRHPRRHSRIS